MTMQKFPKAAQANFKPYLKFLIAVLFIGTVFMLLRYWRANIIISDILAIIEQVGFWAPIFYIIVYVLISGILIPSIVIKIFAGTIFGVFWGVVLVSVAATLSSSIKFFLARYLFRENILKKIKKSENLMAIDRLIEADGWKMLLILRNVPVVSSMLLNYICGLTKMGFKDFAVASFIGRLPTSIMYVYFGYIVRYVYTLELPADTREYLTLEKIMLFIGLMATVGASFYVFHLCRKILTKRMPSM